MAWQGRGWSHTFGHLECRHQLHRVHWGAEARKVPVKGPGAGCVCFQYLQGHKWGSRGGREDADHYQCRTLGVAELGSCGGIPPLGSLRQWQPPRGARAERATFGHQKDKIFCPGVGLTLHRQTIGPSAPAGRGFQFFCRKRWLKMRQGPPRGNCVALCPSWA